MDPNDLPPPSVLHMDFHVSSPSITEFEFRHWPTLREESTDSAEQVLSIIELEASGLLHRVARPRPYQTVTTSPDLDHLAI